MPVHELVGIIDLNNPGETLKLSVEFQTEKTPEQYTAMVEFLNGYLKKGIFTLTPPNDKDQFSKWTCLNETGYTKSKEVQGKSSNEMLFFEEVIARLSAEYNLLPAQVIGDTRPVDRQGVPIPNEKLLFRDSKKGLYSPSTTTERHYTDAIVIPDYLRLKTQDELDPPYKVKIPGQEERVTVPTEYRESKRFAADNFLAAAVAFYDISIVIPPSDDDSNSSDDDRHTLLQFKPKPDSKIANNKSTLTIVIMPDAQRGDIFAGLVSSPGAASHTSLEELFKQISKDTEIKSEGLGLEGPTNKNRGGLTSLLQRIPSLSAGAHKSSRALQVATDRPLTGLRERLLSFRKTTEHTQAAKPAGPVTPEPGPGTPNPTFKP